LRTRVAQTIRDLLDDPTVQVIPQSRSGFLEGLALHESRPDKQDSLTDCISMKAMRREGITEVLTHDRHFAQEGFVLLL
jgi:predicted nucleic acid-binding protein